MSDKQVFNADYNCVSKIRELTGNLPDPLNYYQGVGTGTLACPENILCFHRTTLSDIHQASSIHHRYVLICNLGTPGEIFLDEHTMLLQENQAILFFPFQLHHYGTINKDLRWLYITFEIVSDEWLLPLRNQVIQFTEQTQTNLNYFLQQYRDISKSLVEGACLRFSLGKLLAEFSKQAGNAGPLPQKSFTVPALALMPRLNRHIKNSLKEDLSCEAIAASLGLSASHLRSLVRQEIGIGLGAYVRRIRMNEAMALISGKQHTIEEVGHRCGLGSLPTFSRAFKKYTGMSPREFRHSQK